MADYATLGHFLPYLLGKRLRAVVWPDATGERVGVVALLVFMMGYGAGFGVLLNHRESDGISEVLPELLLVLNAAWLVSALVVDFVPTLRPVTRPLPEHFPVSARQNVVTAFLLDLISLRRLLSAVFLLAALVVAPRHGLVPGFGLLLVLGGAVLSFNVRLLGALRRWRHPLLLVHAATLALMVWWILHPTQPYYTALGVAMVLLPCALWAAQLYWVAPSFGARYLPADPAHAAGRALDRLPLEWKVYTRKAWLSLLMGLVIKVLLVGASGLFFVKNGKLTTQGFFYIAFLPMVGFTYANNNLFGFLGAMAANELQRLGLTSRLLVLYARVVGPVVLVDCLLSAVLLLALFPSSLWHLLGLLPLSAAGLAAIGLWGSLYKAKQVVKTVDFANMRNNVSSLMSMFSVGFAAVLYFVPWWWLRVLLAGLVTLSAVWPLREVLANDGELRRRLWRGIST
ncbi:hypothetical protein [Hymenobacter glacialis]|uniref:Uncharacterized protein n=1 Tax=Hymenobacter glacialis TaxID=1908236 RepID=A0A1G1T9K0_9BACT|nr:hypothetical protein [Hymenobacter glacialis]OGX87543.1 hypothetical protein BEN48_11175 [Hymenobacter glacialis]